MGDYDVNDPFYLVREEIQDSVNKLKKLTERWDRLPEGNSEKTKLATSMSSECESILWQLEELDRATQMAEQDFARFKVDANELASRKRWTQSTRLAVEKHQASAQGTLDRARARGGDSGAGAGGGSRLDNAVSQQNDQYIQEATDQQQLLMNKQDVDLDDISASINRIGQVGLTIGEELEQQGKMLDELEDDVEGVQSRLKAAHRKMEQVLKKAGSKGQIAIIAILTVLLIVLFLVAFM